MICAKCLWAKRVGQNILFICNPNMLSVASFSSPQSSCKVGRQCRHRFSHLLKQEETYCHYHHMARIAPTTFTEGWERGSQHPLHCATSQQCIMCWPQELAAQRHYEGSAQKHCAHGICCSYPMLMGSKAREKDVATTLLLYFIQQTERCTTCHSF